MNYPDPNTIFPIPNVSTVTFIKPTITRPDIIAGDFSYYAGSDFEAHVTNKRRKAPDFSHGDIRRTLA